MRSFLVIYSILFLGNLLSQVQTVGVEFKFSKNRTYFEGIVGKSNNDLVGVSVQYNKSKTNQLYINKFNYKTLDLSATYPITLPKSKKFELVPNQLFLVDGQLYLICFKPYKKLASKVICAYNVSSDGALGSYHRLDSIAHIGTEDKDLYHLIQDKGEKKIVFFTNKFNTIKVCHFWENNI